MRIPPVLFLAAVLTFGSAFANPQEELAAAFKREDYATVARLIEPLAAAGDVTAQYMLGGFYFAGTGVPANRDTANHWLGKAAQQGHAGAQLAYAVSLARSGNPNDVQEGAVWAIRAADQGHAPAQFMVAEGYAAGTGVPKDFQRAASYYRKAAEQGNVGAQAKLGNLYLIGQGVPKDYEQGILWGRKAANAGNVLGQIALSGVYFGGRGVAKSVQQAYFWLLLASVSGGDDIRQMRDDMEKTLSPKEREAAQVDARKWKPSTR